MTEQETINRMMMQVLEEDCYINPELEIEYPIPAISCFLFCHNLLKKG